MAIIAIFLTTSLYVPDTFGDKTITDSATGGDCNLIGNWNNNTKTCTLSQNVSESIIIGSNAITLDGNGHNVTAPVPEIGNGILLQIKFGVTIKNVQIQDFKNGIILNNAINNFLINNTISGSDNIGINLIQSNGNQFLNNLINGSSVGVHISDSDDSFLENNIIQNTGTGIETISSLRPILNKNTLTNNTSFGIKIHSSSFFPIVTNNLSEDADRGIYVSINSGPIIVTNNTSNNNNKGIDITGSSGNFTLKGNTFSENNFGGIVNSIQSSSTFKENTFSNNTVKGLDINTGQMMVFNNNFIDNPISATSASQSVIFSPSEETGGNYWSDYSTLCSNINNDNYCDSPYPFDGGTVNVNDDYVWIQPDGWLTKFNGTSDIIINATDTNDVIVNYAVSATEDGNPISVSCVPTSGSLFSIGNSTVVCTAQNGIVSSFSVTVNFFDEDSDGIGDEFDNCPLVSNPGQEDADNDEIGDACEPDTDMDGVIDDDDNCPLISNPDQSDANTNGVGDVCEDPNTDTDMDGVPDISDNCPLDSNSNQSDIDIDGIGDVCDPVSHAPCQSLPDTGIWIVNTSCTLANSYFAPSNIMVQNDTVLVIPANSTLSVKPTNNLQVILGSGVLIESGGSFKIQPAPPQSASVSIPQGTFTPGCELTNECFIPYEVTIGVGGTVTWTNNDSAHHTVTSGSPGGGPSGEFNSNLFPPETTFEHTFDTTGDYPYFCLVHPWQSGIVTVQ